VVKKRVRLVIETWAEDMTVAQSEELALAEASGVFMDEDSIVIAKTDGKRFLIPTQGAPFLIFPSFEVKSIEDIA
jgi:hypothetical protein